MIGNDVIDLAVARIESNWQRKGFLAKIFTAAEQALILNAQNPTVMVWDLWSRKEAAYKIYNRATGHRAFNPLQFECSEVFSEIGNVVCLGNRYYTHTEISETCIHTIAVEEKESLKEVVVLEDDTPIKKIGGLPFLEQNDKVLSLSHHGAFKRIVALKL